MRAELAGLNHCAVTFLSRADANLCWYYYTIKVDMICILTLLPGSVLRRYIPLHMPNHLVLPWSYPARCWGRYKRVVQS